MSSNTSEEEEKIEVSETEQQPVSSEEEVRAERAAIPEKKVEKERRLKRRGPSKRLKILEEKAEDYDGERFLTIRFYPRVLSAPKWKRAKKAIKVLKERILKYVKNVEEPGSGRKIRIHKPILWVSPEVNEVIWSRGARNPPRKIRVKVFYKIIDADKGEVELRVFPFY